MLGKPLRQAEEAANAATERAARWLVKHRYTVRDVGKLLGLSPQRVSQITPATARSPCKRSTLPSDPAPPAPRSITREPVTISRKGSMRAWSRMARDSIDRIAIWGENLRYGCVALARGGRLSEARELLPRRSRQRLPGLTGLAERIGVPVDA